MKKIAVCSRHPILVAGLRTLVTEPAGMALFECSDAEELRAHFESDPPDLALIDVNSGVPLPFLSTLKSLDPGAGLVLWVDGVAPESIRQAISFGALGVLRKDAPIGLYVQCLERVAAGQLWLEDEMTQKLLSARTVRLSPRERQLVSLLTQGLRNKEIAWRMNITEGTTKVYLSRLFEKTGASDRFELAMFVLQNLGAGPNGGPSLGALTFSQDPRPF